jgi:hypothetical protein
MLLLGLGRRRTAKALSGLHLALVRYANEGSLTGGLAVFVSLKGWGVSVLIVALWLVVIMIAGLIFAKAVMLQMDYSTRVRPPAGRKCDPIVAVNPEDSCVRLAAAPTTTV